MPGELRAKPNEFLQSSLCRAMSASEIVSDAVRSGSLDFRLLVDIWMQAHPSRLQQQSRHVTQNVATSAILHHMGALPPPDWASECCMILLLMWHAAPHNLCHLVTRMQCEEALAVSHIGESALSWQSTCMKLLVERQHVAFLSCLPIQWMSHT